MSARPVVEGRTGPLSPLSNQKVSPQVGSPPPGSVASPTPSAGHLESKCLAARHLTETPLSQDQGRNHGSPEASRVPLGVRGASGTVFPPGSPFSGPVGFSP